MRETEKEIERAGMTKTHTDTEKLKPERHIVNRNFRDKLKIFKYFHQCTLDVNNKDNESQCYIKRF